MDKTSRPFQVAIFLYQGVTALDAVGPSEVLSRVPNTELRFVGKEIGPITTESGALLLAATHTLAETMTPDLCPGIVWDAELPRFKPSPARDASHIPRSCGPLR